MKRLAKEVEKMRREYPGEYSFVLDDDMKDIEIVQCREGEQLMIVKFSKLDKYPYQPPLIDLLYLHIPISDKVCRNGTDICDCAFRESWSPATTLRTVMNDLYAWLQHADQLPKKCDFGGPLHKG